MGPRRWAVTGLCFVVVGALIFLFREASRPTSRVLMIVGAAFSLVGIFAEGVLRIRLRSLARRKTWRS
jgi:hypothetical membrane protein